jgi:hypothetical protein
MFDLKPDCETTLRRMGAFWACDLLDRPLVTFTLYKPPAERTTAPPAHHADPAARWLDAAYQAECVLADLSSQEFLGDTLPVASVNLGPDVFAALYGCPLNFGDFGTSWSQPILHDWAAAGEIRLDLDGFYLRKLLELTDAFLQAGRGRFITGMTDWHPGGDLLAALRGPQALAIDLLDAPQQVQALLDRLQPDYFQVYDLFYEKLRRHGLPISTWLPLASASKYYVVSNDFSIMIGSRLFREVFLPGIAAECRFLDRSIYHLDGPGALRHLDDILAIAALDALQFVPGAGGGGYERWIPVYQRAQAAGKAIQVQCVLEEVPRVIETLRPQGVMLTVEGVPDRESGEALLRAAERWARGR